MKDLVEIKHLLLYRFVLSHPSLLPTTIQTDSFEDFLGHKDIADSDL